MMTSILTSRPWFCSIVLITLIRIQSKQQSVPATRKIPNDVIHMIGKDQIIDFKRIMYRFILCDYFSIALYAIHYITIRLWLIRLPLHRADPLSA